MENTELSEDFISHYKNLLKDEIRNRKEKDKTYVPGKHPNIDRI